LHIYQKNDFESGANFEYFLRKRSTDLKSFLDSLEQVALFIKSIGPSLKNELRRRNRNPLVDFDGITTRSAACFIQPSQVEFVKCDTFASI
jgi:hypothetical protein